MFYRKTKMKKLNLRNRSLLKFRKSCRKILKSSIKNLRRVIKDLTNALRKRKSTSWLNIRTGLETQKDRRTSKIFCLTISKLRLKLKMNLLSKD
jgi:hypothetical protein